MPAHTAASPHLRVALTLTAACAAALALAAGQARASDAHGDHAPAKAPASAAASAPAHALASAPARTPRGAAPDPMDALREKLATKLGAAKAPDSKNPNVLRVTSRSAEPAEEPRASQRHLAAAPTHAAPRATGHAKGAAAAHGVKPKAGHDEHGAGHELHWDYQGAGGPAAWGELKPEFAACSAGKRQSPIDIRGGVRVDLEPIQFDYRPTGFRVVDNGHTVQVNVAAGNSLEVMGRRYELLQFHFHRPSEERIEGRQFDMVAHLVHKDPDGRLAVVAVMLERGSAHALVQQVWNNLPLEKNDEVVAKGELDLSRLLPTERRYYTYMGSLTTPPCSEGVLWMVMQQPVALSPEQINVFARLYPMNARPVQQAGDRLIKQSN